MNFVLLKVIAQPVITHLEGREACACQDYLEENSEFQKLAISSEELWDRLMSMKTSGNEVTEDVGKVLSCAIRVLIDKASDSRGVNVPEELLKTIKEMIAVSPSLFVSDGEFGGLKQLFQTKVSLMSSETDGGRKLSLRESLVKFVLEEKLNWSQKEGRSLPTKLILDKNERLFINLWPDIQRSWKNEGEAVAFEVAVKLDLQESDGVGSSCAQMLERAKLSEDLVTCSHDEYVKKVAAEFEKLKGTVDGECELQGATANYSQYLQSAAVKQLSSEDKGHRVNTIKKLCMLPELSLAAVDSKMSRLLEGCNPSEKRECLRLAAERGNVQMIAVLLAAGVAVGDDSDPISPLYTAVLCGKQAAIEKLLRAGANINDKAAILEGACSSETTNSYTAFGLMVSGNVDIEFASYFYNYTKGVKGVESQQRMNDKMSVVGLTVNRLIKNDKAGIAVNQPELDMLLDMIRSAPKTFLDTETPEEGRPITRLFGYDSPVFSELKKTLLADKSIDWGDSLEDGGKSDVDRLSKRRKLMDTAEELNDAKLNSAFIKTVPEYLGKGGGGAGSEYRIQQVQLKEDLENYVLSLLRKETVTVKSE